LTTTTPERRACVPTSDSRVLGFSGNGPSGSPTTIGVHREAEPVEQAVLEQCVREPSVSEHDQVPVAALLQCAHLLDHVAPDEHRVVPVRALRVEQKTYLRIPLIASAKPPV
jgi:hypothetical protein